MHACTLMLYIPFVLLLEGHQLREGACSRTGACLRSDAVSDGWMTDVVLCLISQSESYSPARCHVL